MQMSRMAAMSLFVNIHRRPILRAGNRPVRTWSPSHLVVQPISAATQAKFFNTTVMTPPNFELELDGTPVGRTLLVSEFRLRQ